MIYDNEGITVSFLGSYNDEYYGNTPVFLVSNDTDSLISVGSEYDTAQIEGAESEPVYLDFTGTSLPAGDRALIFSHVLNEDTFEPAAFEAVNLELQIHSEDGSRYTQLVPLHLEAEGDALSVTAEDPYYPDYALEMMEIDQEAAEEAARDEERERNAEDVQDPVMEKSGVYTYPVGTSYNSAVITAMVRNPNEHTYLHHLKLTCDVYGADDSLLGTARPYYAEEVTLAPGETLPYTMSLSDIPYGTESAYAVVHCEDYRTTHEADLETDKEMWGLVLTTDEIHLDHAEAAEGNRGSTIYDFSYASINGTLTNDGETADSAYLYAVLYNTDGEIILSVRHHITDLAAGASEEFSADAGVAIYELPGYDHAEIYILK